MQVQVFDFIKRENKTIDQTGSVVDGKFIPSYGEIKIKFELVGRGHITGLPIYRFAIDDVIHGQISGQLHWDGAIEQRRWKIEGLYSIINEKGVHLFLGRPNSQAIIDAALEVMRRDGLTHFG